MTRRSRPSGAILLGATAASCFVAGCGSGKASPTTVAKTATSDKIRVFFRSGATRAQEQSAEERLRREPCVRRVVFVSKAQALKKMKKQFPDLFKSGQPLPGNPLPDSVTVTAGKLSCVSTIGAGVAHWPGVATVKWRT